MIIITTKMLHISKTIIFLWVKLWICYDLDTIWNSFRGSSLYKLLLFSTFSYMKGQCYNMSYWGSSFCYWSSITPHQNIGQATNGWQIVKAMHHCMIVVLSKALSIVSKVNYVVINVGEVTTINWVNILLYMIMNWKHIPTLQALEKVEVGANAYNIKDVILGAMGRYGGFTN